MAKVILREGEEGREEGRRAGERSGGEERCAHIAAGRSATRLLFLALDLLFILYENLRFRARTLQTLPAGLL